MYPHFRSLLFRMDPERAHNITLAALRLTGDFTPSRWLLQATFGAQPRPVTAFGLTFKNPVGLAAGYDRDGRAIAGLAALGFGHIEIGTVTPLPQPGSPKPRLFRLVEDEALIDRMELPSRGSAFVQSRLYAGPGDNWLKEWTGLARGGPSRRRRVTGGAVLGVNLGSNRETSNEQAIFDYLELLQNFAAGADYLTINVSLPNTAALRDLQRRQALQPLLTQMHAQRLLEQERIKRHIPLLVKLAADLTDPELDDALEVILDTQMDGVVIGGTTLAREGLVSGSRDEDGGLSGRPLGQRSEAMLATALRRVGDRLPIVSVGGILGPDDAKRRLDMGATLVQLYTGLTYSGPGLVKKIVNSLPR